MSIVVKPPNNFEGNHIKMFLAGTIDMGNSVDWQKVVCDGLSDENVILLNPRRDDWNSDWEQTIDNDYFRGQVEWELNNLDVCDIILMYFDKDSKSPISLLELGLYADQRKMIVCCPQGFYRKGNVDIVCKKYNIKVVETLDQLIQLAKQSIF